MSRLVRATGALILTGALVVPSAPAAAAPAPMDTTDGAAFTLTLLHGNDPESALLHAPADAEYGGAARFTALLQELRASERDGEDAAEGESAHRGVVTVNSGDMYLPGPEFAASQEEGAPFYDAIAASHAQYDAISMGNHEFDFGPDLYADFIGELPASTTVVAANVDVSAEPGLAAHEEAGRIAPSTVVDVEDEQVGIVGALFPALATITSSRDVVVDEVVAPVQAEVDRLTAEGVDKIIMISHLQNITFEERVARELTDVDVIVAGGGHEVMANEGDALVPDDEITVHPGTGEPLSYPLVAENPDGDEVLIVTAGSNYKYVGRLVLNFDADGNVDSVGDRSGPVVVDGSVEPDPEVEAQVTKPVADYVDELAETEVAQSEVALEGRQSPGVRTQETNLGNLMADALVDTGARNAETYGVPEPQIGIQNGGGIRNASLIPAGPLSALDTYSIAPFANQVAVVPDVPRAQVKELLEHGVSAAPAANGGFMQVGGVNFAYDPERTAQQVDEDGAVLTPGERVRNVILHDGTVVVEDGEVVDGDAITIATNDFSARGGDMYPFRGADFTVVGSTYQGALELFVTDTLAGAITAEDYPEGGSGRIVVGDEATAPPGGGDGGDGDDDDNGAPSPDPSDGPSEDPSSGPSDGPGTGGGAADGDKKDDQRSLPLTGGALTGLIIAALVAVGAGGGALYLSRKRASTPDSGEIDA
ncbi:5'-nucleotidase C-terminal domain-containing protein [Nocardiopsis sp. MG754419]|uniref:5'-nucleotidase C-terminal domain-containing protein n=1 Tax=Nocardiopsis sp. MG754419 TaxID=2259865 RepID=UPI001BAE3734|nr:5'-nucleotidase C-terminal domain-containing protein [Nocardiopsis sp. MG754419]MBR8744179.1 bifunctional metallophosphatase/5'-nucleotidase [Nocardiopsis sp. MG754419]